MFSPLLRTLGPAVFLTLALGLASAAEVPVGESITVVDAAGKEIKLTNIRFTQGFRRLAWLGEPSAATEDGKKGPWALELREPNSTTYEKGVLTLVPLPSVESVKYDYDKFTTTVALKGLKDPVVGTCRFKGFCFLGLEGEAGGGKAKLTGGAIKTGFKSLTFPAAKPLPAREAKGTSWSITLESAKPGDPPLVVRNLKTLYQLPGGLSQVTDSLPARKGEPLAFGSGTKPTGFKSLEVVAVDGNKKTLVLDVNAGERTAVVPTGEVDKKPATLLGLLGEVDAGWKLFPLHTIHEVKPQ